MELHGSCFGTIGYEEKDLLEIPSGLVGMPNLTRFLILDFEEQLPFKWLQSADEPSLGFLIAEPQLFRSDFALALAKEDLQDLDVDSLEDLVVFVLCTYRGDLEETTGNLLGPIIVHAGKRVGQQIIIEDGGFSAHESLTREEDEPKEEKEGRPVASNCG